MVHRTIRPVLDMRTDELSRPWPRRDQAAAGTTDPTQASGSRHASSACRNAVDTQAWQKSAGSDWDRS